MNLEVIHTDCDSSYTVNIAMGIKVILNMNILELNKIILLFLLRRFPNETVSCLALCLDQARSWVMCLVKIIDIFGSLSPCHYLTVSLT